MDSMKSTAKKKSRTCIIFGALGVFALGAIITAGAYFYFFGNLPWQGGAATLSGPAVSIQEPANGTEVKTGASFPISAYADDENGVVRLDLWVDDTVVLRQESPEAGGLTPLTLNYPLAAVKPGTYALMARAYNGLGELGESAIHYVTVADSNVSTQDYAQYVVQEGDTLENIASRLGVSVDSIRQANPQLGAGPVQPGQVIIVPVPPKNPAQAAVPPQAGAQPVNQQQQNVQKQKAPDPSNPSKQISVKTASVSPSPVYYGQKCTTEASVVNVTAKIEPANTVSKVNLTYSYINKAGTKTKKPEVAMQLSAGEYKGSVDVKKDAETLFGQDGGKVEVLVEAHDKDGKVSISSLYTVTVNLCPAQGGAVQIPPNQGGVQWQGPGIAPAHIDKFAPGAISQAGPGLDQVDPSLFPDHRISVLPPDFGSVKSPTELNAISTEGCKITLTWKDNATDETAYEVFRVDPGKPRFNRIAQLPPGSQQYDDRTSTTGKFGYYVLATRTLGGKASVGDSKIAYADVKKGTNCNVAAGPKRLFFQPVEFKPKDGAITKGYLLLAFRQI